MAEMEWLPDYVIAFMKSPTWIAPISQFIDERCSIFEEAEENQLSHLKCHEEFQHLIQDLFVAHLTEVSISPEEFERFCASGLGGHQQLHRTLVEQLLSVDDFPTFKAMMCRHNAELCREVVTFECADEDDFNASQSLSPTRGVAQLVVANSIEEGINLNTEWHLYEEQEFVSTKCGGLGGTLRGSNSLAGTLNPGANLGATTDFGNTMGSTMGVPLGTLNLAGTMGSNADIDFNGTMVGSLGGTMNSQLGRDLAGDVLAAIVSNIDLICEQARLETNIALQLQLEEERLRVLAEQAGPPMQIPASAGFVSAPIMGLPPRMKQVQPGGTQDVAAAMEVPRLVQVEPLQPLCARPWGFTSAPLMRKPSKSAPADPADPPPRQEPAQPAPVAPAPLPNGIGFSSSPLCFRPPPLKLPTGMPQEAEVPKADFSSVQPHMEVQEMASNLAEWRARAEQAITGAEEPGQPAQRVPAQRYVLTQAASNRPSQEERQQRAEHLRRQRDALVAKRNAERERQVTDLPQRRGRQSIDQAASADERRAAGRRLVAELAPGAHVAPPGVAASADTAAAAEQMRRALTLQLRQTLCSSMVSDAALLQDQISQLHHLRRQGAAP